MVLEGAINGAAFLAWVKQELAPQLKPGDVVVMDNLKPHKVAGICEAIEARGAQVRYLPPYSPEFNPIEQVFSKIKTLLRAAGARSQAALHSAIARLMDTVTPNECRNYFQHCGYCGQSG
jgi:transposase